jgi:hypothetical protein
MTNAPPPYVPRTPPAPPSIEKKKTLYKRRWFWIAIVLLAGIGACAAIVVGGGGAPVKNAAEPNTTIVYSVTGSGTPTVSTITYATVGNGKQNAQVAVSHVHIPWSKTITTSDPPSAFSLSVTNGAIGLSYVTCTITENGELLITNTSKGPFAIAACDAAGTN